MRIIGFIKKFFGISAASLAVIALASYGLMSYGKMPVKVYYRAFAAFAELHPSSGPFDGIWRVTATSAIAETDEAYCGEAEGQIFVKGKTMNGGVINEFGDTFRITAKLNHGGEISGGMAQGIANQVDFSGTLLDSNGSAKWKDKYGCYGETKFERVYATGSHELYYINYVNGRGVVIRGFNIYPAEAGFPLRSGDVVAVEDASVVKVNLGQQGLTLTEKTKYEVMEGLKPEASPTFLDRSWEAFKVLIQGEDYRIPPADAVAGVRG